MSIFLGDVFATIFVAGAAYIFVWLLKYPGFRVGANWTFVGWDVNRMGCLPNETDQGEMEFMPNVAVTSRDPGIKKIIFADPELEPRRETFMRVTLAQWENEYLTPLRASKFFPEKTHTP